MLLWRLCSARYPALTGEGARRAGGRWNHKGTKMVYCSGSLALAVLEVFVHLDSSLLPDDLVAVAVEVPDEIVIDRLDPATLPPDWRDIPGPEALRDTGTDWVASGTGVALAVPSAIIEQEWNYLLNPDHPEFAKLLARAPEPFRFDARMQKAAPAVPAKPKRKTTAPKKAKSKTMKKGTATAKRGGRKP